MVLPAVVTQQIEKALIALQIHPQQTLMPIERLAIYDAFGFRSNLQEQRVRAYLALITAQRVLPLWQVAFPSDDMPKRMLVLAEGVLRRTVDTEVAAREMADAWYHHPQSGDSEEYVLWHIYCAGEAALNAVSEALGKNPLAERIQDYTSANHKDPIYIKDAETITDNDLVYGVADTASSAAIAYAGRIDGGDGYLIDSPSDPEKRREFWEWWLTEAIPQAWELAAEQPQGSFKY